MSDRSSKPAAAVEIGRPYREGGDRRGRLLRHVRVAGELVGVIETVATNLDGRRVYHLIDRQAGVVIKAYWSLYVMKQRVRRIYAARQGRCQNEI